MEYIIDRKVTNLKSSFLHLSHVVKCLICRHPHYFSMTKQCRSNTSKPCRNNTLEEKLLTFISFARTLHVQTHKQLCSFATLFLVVMELFMTVVTCKEFVQFGAETDKGKETTGREVLEPSWWKHLAARTLIMSMRCDPWLQHLQSEIIWKVLKLYIHTIWENTWVFFSTSTSHDAMSFCKVTDVLSRGYFAWGQFGSPNPRSILQ